MRLESRDGRKFARCFRLVSLAKAAANVSKRRIFPSFAADAQIRTIRFRESGTLEAFAHTALLIIDGWEIREGWGAVLENLQGFAPPLHAAVKL